MDGGGVSSVAPFPLVIKPRRNSKSNIEFATISLETGNDEARHG
jgi:hypothetical protein